MLPSAFVQARFDFRGKTLTGQQELATRWKQAVDGTNGTLGEAAGKLYIAKYFKPEAKARMDALVKNLINAYKVGIDSLEWMSPETKAQAKDKLAHFTVKIGCTRQAARLLGARDQARRSVRQRACAHASSSTPTWSAGSASRSTTRAGG